MSYMLTELMSYRGGEIKSVNLAMELDLCVVRGVNSSQLVPYA